MSNADQLLARAESAKLLRTDYDSAWQEIAVLLFGGSHATFNTKKVTKGGKRNGLLYTGTALILLRRHAAMLEALLMPRNQYWHGVKTSDENLNKRPEVKEFCDQLRRLLFVQRYNSVSSFAGNNFEVLLSQSSYGNGCMAVIDNLRPQILYRSVPLQNIYITEDQYGRIDGFYRYYTITASQAVRLFKEVPDKVRVDLEKQPNAPHEFCQVCLRNDDPVATIPDSRAAWYSWDYHVGEKMEVDRGPYTSQPYAFARGPRMPEEMYGQGVVHDALADIKSLNDFERALNEGRFYKAKKAIITAPGLNVGKIRPGMVIEGALSQDGRRLAETLEIGDSPNDAEQEHGRLYNKLMQAFNLDLFELLIDKPDMTATEVLQRSQERGMFLSPSMGLMQTEFIAPMVAREINIIELNGMLPPVPSAIKEAGGQIDIVYESPITQAQRSGDIRNLRTLVEQALAFAQIPEGAQALDIIDFEKALEATADSLAIPTSITRSGDELEGYRRKRQEAQQQQQIFANAPAAAGALKDLAQAGAIAGGGA